MSKLIHQEFLEIAHSLSPRLSEAMEQVGPVRLSKRKDLPLADTLCRAVAGQQLSTKAASTIWSRVAELAGQQRVVDFVHAAPEKTLRTCGLSQAKSKTMKAIALAANRCELEEDELRGISTENRVQRLTSIWGVGQWTADMTNMFFFGDPDVWPQGDLTVVKTLERLTGRRRKTINTAMRFAPRRTYLALYMYRIADQPAN